MINSNRIPHENYHPLMAARSTQMTKLGDHLGPARGVLLALVMGVTFWACLVAFIWM